MFTSFNALTSLLNASPSSFVNPFAYSLSFAFFVISSLCLWYSLSFSILDIKYFLPIVVAKSFLIDFIVEPYIYTIVGSLAIALRTLGVIVPITSNIVVITFKFCSSLRKSFARFVISSRTYPSNVLFFNSNSIFAILLLTSASSSFNSFFLLFTVASISIPIVLYKSWNTSWSIWSSLNFISFPLVAPNTAFWAATFSSLP